MNHSRVVPKMATVISLAERRERGRLLPPISELRRKHAHLDIVLEALVAAYREGAWADVLEEWASLDPGLRALMDREELELLPSFRRVNPDEAADLVAQNAELRTMLDIIGVGVDLHSLALLDLAALGELLREHVEREEQLFYPWHEEVAASRR